MAEKEKDNISLDEEQAALVDPIYQKFSKGVIRALGSTDFYQYFMDAMLFGEEDLGT